MKKIDEAVAAIRANPVRYAAWMLLLLVLAAAGLTVADGLGIDLYLFTH
ncbi:MAG: hypothetical protein ACXWC4_09615 [Telluria sp.]